MRHAGPILVLALCSLLLTWPLALHLTDALPDAKAPDEDVLVNIWSFWQARAALVDGRGTLFHTTDLFHPTGTTLTLSSNSLASAVPFVPLMRAMPGMRGLVLAWNLNVLLTFFVSALGAYFLAERVTRQPWAAVVAGLVFGFAPYRYAHLRQVSLSCTQWLPFVFHALLARLEGGGVAAALGCAVAGALTAAASPTYAAYVPLFALTFVAVWAFTQPDRRAAARAAAAALPLPIALGALFAAPVLWPAVRDMISLPTETPVWDDPVSFAMPLEAFVFFNRHPYVGLGVLGLACAALARRAGSAPWAAIAFLGLSLAPGPVVKTVHATTQIPLPYALVRYFPGLTHNRFCERFEVFWFLGAAVLVAQALAGYRPFARSPRLWAALAGAGLMLELRHAPLELAMPEVPPLYAALAEAPAGWPVYEWPADYLSNRRFMFYQTVHQRPICQGVLARRTVLSYQLEELDYLGPLDRMILVVHEDFPADEHHRARLAELRRRFEFKPFRRDGPREAFLLSRKR